MATTAPVCTHDRHSFVRLAQTWQNGWLQLFVAVLFLHPVLCEGPKKAHYIIFDLTCLWTALKTTPKEPSPRVSPLM